MLQTADAGITGGNQTTHNTSVGENRTDRHTLVAAAGNGKPVCIDKIHTALCERGLTGLQSVFYQIVNVIYFQPEVVLHIQTLFYYGVHDPARAPGRLECRLQGAEVTSQLP